MKPEQLRAALQAKQPKPAIIPQKVATFANKDEGIVYLKFQTHEPHLRYTRAEAMSQVKDLIAACRHIGVKITQELKWE